MTKADVVARFPTLYEVVKNSRLDADIERAAGAVQAIQDGASSTAALKKAGVRASVLLAGVLGDIDKGYRMGFVQRLERDLTELRSGVSVAELRRAFRAKLVNDAQFVDVVYEIAGATALRRVADANTLKLEPAIGDEACNSDSKAMIGGKSLRVEVKVVHDTLFPPADQDFEDAMESADVPGGYVVQLRYPVKTQADALAVGILIEEAYDHHAANPGQDFEVDETDFYFDVREGAYVAGDGLVESVQFLPDDSWRYISGPAMTRATLDKDQLAALPKAEGVYTTRDIKFDPRTHSETPMGQRIFQAVEGKLRQCEPDIANIVLIGLPQGGSMEDAHNAFIEGHVAVFRAQSGRVCSMEWRGTHDGPFIPANCFEKPNASVEQFRKVSAVWVAHVGTPATSRLIPNPNAAVPLAEADVLRIERSGLDVFPIV